MSTCILSLSGHTQSVTCIRWGGRDLIYSSSQDRTIKVWRREDVIFFKLSFFAKFVYQIKKKGCYV
jgi:WD40 repeat protein